MEASLDNLTRGMEVEIGRVDRELKRLWDGAGGVATRASMMNFAVYAEGEDSLERNGNLLAKLAQDHACRGIVVAAEPGSPDSAVRAWISAHCHVSRAGAKQVCSEQVSFLLQGGASRMMANVVLSHLDSDLPLFFWWQGPFPAQLDEQLMAWVDRFIFDSRDWTDAKAQLKTLRAAHSENEARLILCDLNWTRLIHTRLALAQTFDHPQARKFLPQVREIHLCHASDSRTTALLMAGCMASQMGLERDPARKASDGWIFKNLATGGDVEFAIEPAEGAPISCVRLTGEGGSIELRREAGSEYLRVEAVLPGCENWHQMLPAAQDTIYDTVVEELIRGGRHALYLRSLDKVGDLI